MGTYMSGHITIGGTLSRRRRLTLAAAAAAEGVSSDWGAEALTRRECLALLNQAHVDQEPVEFYDEQASYGHFEDLETVCRELGLTYAVHSEAEAEYDASYTWWRPGMDRPVACYAANNGTVLLDAEAVTQALAAEQPLDALRALLARELPPDVPPLTLVTA